VPTMCNFTICNFGCPDCGGCDDHGDCDRDAGF
jgi:hypothetical protein